MAETTHTPIKVDLASPKLHHGGDEIQKFGTIRKMPLGLRDAARTESCELLNVVLADTTILYSLVEAAAP